MKASKMQRQILPILEFQKRLADNFGRDGPIGWQLAQLVELERRAGASFAQKYIGHQHLSEAWQSFFYGSIKTINQALLDDMNLRIREFAFVYLEYIMIFRKIRSASELSMRGYLGPAYSLLRDVKDRTIHLSAVFQRTVTYSDLMGISNDDPPKAARRELANIQRKRRTKTERYLLEQFIGNLSGLVKDDIEELQIWSELFDREIHGSFLSTARTAVDWVKESKPVEVVTIDDEGMDALFMNRFCEVAWMTHRLLAVLQAGDVRFSPRWAEHWEILDSSFWQMQIGLKSIGKNIGEVIVRYVDTKFPFTPEFRLERLEP